MENLENEQWLQVEGYEGLYEVSNLGRVKSLKFGKERILKQTSDKDGYLRVQLSKQGKVKMKLIHRLVAMAFIPNPFNLPQVNHINEDKDLNVVSNLEWISNIDNLNYGTRNQRIAKSNTNGKCSKKVKQYTLEGELLKEWQSTMEIQRQLGFSNGNISQCCLGKHKHAYNFIWEYAE